MSTTKESEGSAALARAYSEAFHKSRALDERAKKRLPGGVSSTLRQHKPFPVYVERAQGSRKWTVEGRELIDYWMGHSALIQGHNAPQLVAAASEQLARGTHFGALTEHELELAEEIGRLVPSAERVRFVGTGSESVHLALRLARAATGKRAFIKLHGHYHGWLDNVARALRPPFDDAMSAGVPNDDDALAVVIAPNDLTEVERAFAAHDDIGAILLEPYGGYSGLVSTTPEYVAGLRALCDKHGAILIFDETVSGFRMSPGGYQQAHGVKPDLSIFGKALFGGFPGAALAGRAELMELTARAGTPEFVYHGGTWNGFPVSMAVGLANLRVLADGALQRRIDDVAARLRVRITETYRAHGLDAAVHGTSSMLILFAPYEEVRVGAHANLPLASVAKYHTVRQALVLEGIDVPRFPCTVSDAHTDEDIEETAAAVGRAIDRLDALGLSLA